MLSVITPIGLDPAIGLVLLIPPSLRSDSPPSFDNLSKALRWRGPGTLGMEKNILTVLQFDFLIAVVVKTFYRKWLHELALAFPLL